MATLIIDHGASPVELSKTIHNYTYVERKPHIKTITYDYSTLTDIVGPRPTYDYNPLNPNKPNNQYDRYSGICYLTRPITTDGVIPKMYTLANDPIQFVDAGADSYYIGPTDPNNPNNGDFTVIDDKVRDVVIYEYVRPEEDAANHTTTTYLYIIPCVQPWLDKDHMNHGFPTVMDTPYQWIAQPNGFTHSVTFWKGNPPVLEEFPYGDPRGDQPIPSLSYVELRRVAQWNHVGDAWIKRQYSMRFDSVATLSATKTATNVSDVFDGIPAWILSGRSTLGYKAQLTEWNEAKQAWDDIGNPITNAVSCNNLPDPLVQLQQTGTANIVKYDVQLTMQEVVT